jgi:hypothetical protein
MLFNFDPPEIGWTLSGGAAIRSDLGAHSAPNSLYLFGRKSAFLGDVASTASRSLSVVPGKTYPVRLMTKGDGAGAVPVQLHFESGLESFDFYLDAPIGSGWQVWEPGSVAFSVASVTLEIDGHTPAASGSGFWLIDDVELDDGVADVGDLSKWKAIVNAKALLEQLAGPTTGWNTDLGGRVYTRLFTPMEETQQRRPYVCLPVNQEGEQIVHGPGGLATSTWKLEGYAYFDDDPESDRLNSDGARQASLFRDDIVRAFMDGTRLLGQAISCDVVAVDTGAGILEDGWCEVEFTISFEQMVGAADLAPEA